MSKKNRTTKKKTKAVELSTEDFENTPEAVLAKFENGSLANPHALTSVKYYSTDNCKSVEPVRKFKRKILVVETDRMTYVSANFGPCCASYHNCCDYYVGVVNKSTKKLKLMNCEWYNLKPAIAGSIFGIESKEEKSAPKDLTLREKRDELTASFGSLRSQRAVESRFRHEVKADDLQGTIKTAVESVDVPDEEKLLPIMVSNATSDAIPPQNLDAVNVDDVYDINDIISADECFALESQATVWAESSTDEVKTLIVEKKYAGFALDCLLNLPVNKEVRIEKCIRLLYLHYLTTVLKLKSSDFRRKDPLPKDMPGVIKKKVLNTYFQTTGKTATSGSLRCMTAEKKDKLMAEIIVLALITNNFRFEYDKLMPDIKTTVKRFQLLVTAVGAKIEKSGPGKLAKPSNVTLSLPLAKLEMHVKRESKRRQ